MSPPLTGASGICTCFRRSAAIARVASGEIVLMSMTTEPGFSSFDHAARAQDYLFNVLGSRDARDDVVARLKALSARRLPGTAATTSCVFPGVLLYTVTSKPALSRFNDMGRPMMPMPIKPTRFASTFGHPFSAPWLIQVCTSLMKLSKGTAEPFSVCGCRSAELSGDFAKQ